MLSLSLLPLLEWRSLYQFLKSCLNVLLCGGTVNLNCKVFKSNTRNIAEKHSVQPDRCPHLQRGNGVRPQELSRQTSEVLSCGLASEMKRSSPLQRTADENLKCPYLLRERESTSAEGEATEETGRKGQKRKREATGRWTEGFLGRWWQFFNHNWNLQPRYRATSQRGTALLITGGSCSGSPARGAWHLGIGSLFFFPPLSYATTASSGRRLIIKIPFHSPCFHYSVSSSTKEQCQHAWIMLSQDWKCLSDCGWNERLVVSRTVVVVSVCAPSLFYLLNKTQTHLIIIDILL